MNKLTLLIPAKHESESLPIVLKELDAYNFEKKIVLEKSDIKTIDSIKNFNCEIIFQKGKGYGNALIEGINLINTEYLCIFNADGSFNPNELNKMLNKCEEGNDFIFSSRYTLGGTSEDDTLFTKFGNFFFTLIGNLFFRLNIGDILYTYVLGRTTSFKDLNLTSNDFRFCVELPIKAKRNNMKYLNIGSHERKRYKGRKKLNEIKDGFLILTEMIKLYFN